MTQMVVALVLLLTQHGDSFLSRGFHSTRLRALAAVPHVDDLFEVGNFQDQVEELYEKCLPVLPITTEEGDLLLDGYFDPTFNAGEDSSSAALNASTKLWLLRFLLAAKAVPTESRVETAATAVTVSLAWRRSPEGQQLLLSAKEAFGSVLALPESPKRGPAEEMSDDGAASWSQSFYNATAAFAPYSHLISPHLSADQVCYLRAPLLTDSSSSSSDHHHNNNNNKVVVAGLMVCCVDSGAIDAEALMGSLEKENVTCRNSDDESKVVGSGSDDGGGGGVSSGSGGVGPGPAGLEEYFLFSKALNARACARLTLTTKHLATGHMSKREKMQNKSTRSYLYHYPHCYVCVCVLV